MSGRAVEASGDVDVLLLDKTGTITLGNRQAAEFLPVDGVDEPLAPAPSGEAASPSCLPIPRSIRLIQLSRTSSQWAILS